MSPDQDLNKAISIATKASELLTKSHVKATTFTNAKGTVVNRKEYDDSRKAAEQATANAEAKPYKFGHEKHNREGAELHKEAALKHIEAMHAAHKSGDNNGVTQHYYAASHHLAMHAGGTRGEKNDKRTTDYNAQETSKIADHISEIANKHGNHGEDTAVDLNHKSSLHIMAQEAHARAAEAHERHSQHFRRSSAEHHEVEGNIDYHRDEARKHGSTVVTTSGKAVDATESAYRASDIADRSNKPEDHRKAAEFHKQAAKLTYDPEGQKEHTKKAKEHRKKASK